MLKYRNTNRFLTNTNTNCLLLMKGFPATCFSTKDSITVSVAGASGSNKVFNAQIQKYKYTNTMCFLN